VARPFGRKLQVLFDIDGRQNFAVCHAVAASVSIHSAAFAAALKPPLTIPLRYCLTMNGKSKERT
jgi:hypothetical protein